MSQFYIGVYWHDRPASLRQHADTTKEFLLLLHTLHPVFKSLEWVGDRPNTAVKLSPDLSNLDDLIYHHAGGRKQAYDVTNPDGTPAWESVSNSGFGMWYGTGKSPEGGGLTISVHTGQTGPHTPNSVLISFPEPADTRFPYREFFDYVFLKRVFLQMIAYWHPNTGRVTSRSFATAVAGDGRPGVGWLTYLSDRRASALRNDNTLKDLAIEDLPDGGVLISLGPTLISPDNLLQVEKARLLRHRLAAEKLISV